jgi:hypothetical protein
VRSRNILVVSAVVVACVLGAAPGFAQSAATAPNVPAECAPILDGVAVRAPDHALRIVGGQDTVPHVLFGTRDLVVINAGTAAGLQIDQQFAIRRPYVFGRPRKNDLRTIHTSGRLRIVSANTTTAIGQIEESCDGVLAGDYLDPFVAPAAVAANGDKAFADLDFSSPGRVLFGDEQRRIAAPGDFMMLDQAAASMMPGTRVGVYRDLQTGVPLTPIGEGVIVSRPDGTAVMRVMSARDAVRTGDYVVPYK